MLRFIRAFTKVKNMSPVEVKDDEIERELITKERGTHLLLGRFTEMDIYEKLEKVGIINELRDKELYPLKLSIEHESLLKQKILIDLTEEAGEKPKRIAEIIIGECKYKPNEKAFPVPIKKPEIKCMVVEWLVLQNVKSVFTEKYPRFPGQRYPGLRIGKLVLKFLENIAQSEKDCFIAFPEFYHNAVMYIDYMHFFNPETEGRVLKMRDDLKNLPLADVSFAFCGGCIIEKKNSEERRITWEAEEMAYPLSEELKSFFNSPEYKAIRDRTYNSYSYSFDRLCYELKQEDLMTKF